MNEGKLREEMDRGAKSAALLRNELLVEAFETLETQYTESWKSSASHHADARERIYMLTTALAALRQHLISVVETGRLAERQLTELNKK
tara:strand:+ start:133 stop:399 length:267 start_codon:yes stop_codon:yes gene_type:complete